MDTSYEELCRRCFDMRTGQSFEENIESCGCVIAAGRDRKDVERAYYVRGLLRADIGDHDGAIEDYGQAIALTPAPRYFESRGEAYCVKGDDAAALSDFARVVELDPGNGMPHLNVGAIHLHRCDYALAVQCFTRAIELNPTHAVAHYDRYLAYASLGDRERSRLDLDKAIELDPDDVIFRAVRGRIHLDEGRLDQAFVDFNRAVEVDPDVATFLYFRAMTRLRQGDAPGAEADLPRPGRSPPILPSNWRRRGSASELPYRRAVSRILRCSASLRAVST